MTYEQLGGDATGQAVGEMIFRNYAEAGQAPNPGMGVWFWRTCYDISQGMPIQQAIDKHEAELRAALGLAPVEPIAPPAGEHVDPASYSMDQLARMRGAMWTKRLAVPFGPRPNQPSNINAFALLDTFTPDDRARMAADYTGVGYTHAVLGPVTGNDRYHGQYPGWMGLPSQAYWDQYLDMVQADFWDRRIIPVYFAHPDGWELPRDSAMMDQLDAFYRQPRAQQLLRVVVYAGWEPSGTKYGWNNEQWVAWLKRGAQVFPNALRCLHHPMDLDAPTGQNDDEVFPPGQGNIISWQNAAPYIHVFLDQVGGYVMGGSPVPTEAFKAEFVKHIERHCKGFRTGYGGWPTTSAWGNRPLTYIMSEYAAYQDYWHDWPESEAIALGNLAMQAGSDGFLDGGTP